MSEKSAGIHIQNIRIEGIFVFHVLWFLFSSATPILKIQGTSLVVQWLRLRASTAGGTGLILGWGTKIPHAERCSQKLN